MKLRLWFWRKPVSPGDAEPAAETSTGLRTQQPSAGPERTTSPAARAVQPGRALEPVTEVPAKAALTLGEAKTAIRAAGGDVIQVGFLASDYLRQREEEPASADTSVSRERLCALIAKRLKDRQLLAAEGTFELREGQ